MKKTLFLLMGLAISAICLWFVLRKVDMAQLKQTAVSLRWGWVAACAAIFYGGFYLRAVRWACFFPPLAEVTGRRIFGPMMMGYALNSLFPGRVGEPARALMVARRSNASVPATLSSVAAERLVDMATLLAFMAAVLATVNFGNFSYQLTQDVTLNEEWFRSMSRKTTLFIALPLTVIILLLMSGAVRQVVERIVQKMTFLPAGLREFFIKVMHAFAEGFAGLKSPVQGLLIAIYSLLIWGSAGWCIQSLAPAFGIEMSFMQATAIMVIICVAILVPATPGYWGLFEAGFFAGAKLLGIEATDAQLAAMALLLHLIQYVPIVLIGLIWASMSGTSLVQAAKAHS